MARYTSTAKISAYVADVICEPDSGPITTVASGIDDREAREMASRLNRESAERGTGEWYGVQNVRAIVREIETSFDEDEAPADIAECRALEMWAGSTSDASAERASDAADTKGSPRMRANNSKPVTRVAITAAIKRVAPSARAAFYPKTITVMAHSAAERAAIKAAIESLGCAADREWFVNRAYMIMFHR